MVTQQEEGLTSLCSHHHSTGSCDAEGGLFAIYILNVSGNSCQTLRLSVICCVEFSNGNVVSRKGGSLEEEQESAPLLWVPQAPGCHCRIAEWQECAGNSPSQPTKTKVSNVFQFFRKHADCQPNVASKGARKLTSP